MHKDYFDIYPTAQLQGRIQLPASKSISNRALLINALCADGVTPDNLSDCDDTQVMLRALHDMPDTIDIGAAGTAMRFLTAYLCVTPGSHTITGSERMRHRPIGILVEALRCIGAKIEYLGEEGFPPLRITGNPELKGGGLSVSGSVSSQFISALLMIGPVLKQGLSLKLTGKVVSRPYLDMTVTIMRQFGAQVEWESDNEVRVSPVPYKSRPYSIENDWSAASYWYEMVALSRDPKAEVVLPGLHAESMQGDSQVSTIFRELGVVTEYLREDDGTEAVRLRKGNNLTCWLSCDLSSQPDLAQTIIVTAAMLDIPFAVGGLRTLRIKETDRIAALCRELGNLGLSIEDKGNDRMEWSGVWDRRVELPEIATYEDHRMAMAFAPACLRMGGIRIMNPAVVSKSYPSYWEHLKNIGFKICS